MGTELRRPMQLHLGAIIVTPGGNAIALDVGVDHEPIERTLVGPGLREVEDGAPFEADGVSSPQLGEGIRMVVGRDIGIGIRIGRAKLERCTLLASAVAPSVLPALQALPRNELAAPLRP